MAPNWGFAPQLLLSGRKLWDLKKYTSVLCNFLSFKHVCAPEKLSIQYFSFSADPGRLSPGYSRTEPAPGKDSAVPGAEAVPQHDISKREFFWLT